MHPLARLACRVSAGIAVFGLFMYGVPGGDFLASVPQRVAAFGEQVGGHADGVVEALRTPGNDVAQRASEVLAEQQAQLCQVQVVLGETDVACRG